MKYKDENDDCGYCKNKITFNLCRIFVSSLFWISDFLLMLEVKKHNKKVYKYRRELKMRADLENNK